MKWRIFLIGLLVSSIPASLCTGGILTSTVAIISSENSFMSYEGMLTCQSKDNAEPVEFGTSPVFTCGHADACLVSVQQAIRERTSSLFQHLTLSIDQRRIETAHNIDEFINNRVRGRGGTLYTFAHDSANLIVKRE